MLARSSESLPRSAVAVGGWFPVPARTVSGRKFPVRLPMAAGRKLLAVDSVESASRFLPKGDANRVCDHFHDRVRFRGRDHFRELRHFRGLDCRRDLDCRRGRDSHLRQEWCPVCPCWVCLDCVGPDHVGPGDHEWASFYQAYGSASHDWASFCQVCHCAKRDRPCHCGNCDRPYHCWNCDWIGWFF